MTFFFGLFRATSTANGSSQPRDQIRAATASPQHNRSNAGSLTQNHISLDTNLVHYCGATMGNPVGFCVCGFVVGNTSSRWPKTETP